MQDLGSCVEIRVGSSPFIRTKYRALVQPLESGIFIPFFPFSPISVRLRSTSWEGTSPIRRATATSRFSAHFIRTKYRALVQPLESGIFIPFLPFSPISVRLRSTSWEGTSPIRCATATSRCSAHFIRTKYRALVQPLESGIFIPFFPFSPISVRLRSTSWEGTSPIRRATATSRFSAHFIRTKYRALVQPLESGIFIPFLPFSPISVRLRSTSWEGTSPIRCATATSRCSAHFIRTKYPQINFFVCL